ncbi:MAG: hypothetical protein CMJ78_02695 [Planctomycetaceae bacterium]|nr:hypothetical protein [Planctomycetaceae bacterium]
MTRKTTRIGLIGYGTIGKEVHKKIDGDPDNGMEVVFVNDMDASLLEGLDSELVLADLADFGSKNADLVVEMAHPEVSRQWATKILEKTDYMLISVTAIADKDLEDAIKETTKQHGTRAYLPHGGGVGVDALLENSDVWDEVNVIMKKPPHNVDCAAAGIDPNSITEETVLYDGPARDICPKFPRNVNTIATLSYAGRGLDNTNAKLIVNPEWNTATVAVEAKAPGVDLNISRVERIEGVTGASTPASIFNSIQMIASNGPGIHIR